MATSVALRRAVAGPAGRKGGWFEARRWEVFNNGTRAVGGGARGAAVRVHASAGAAEARPTYDNAAKRGPGLMTASTLLQTTDDNDDRSHVCPCRMVHVSPLRPPPLAPCTTPNGPPPTSPLSRTAAQLQSASTAAKLRVHGSCAILQPHAWHIPTWGCEPGNLEPAQGALAATPPGVPAPPLPTPCQARPNLCLPYADNADLCRSRMPCRLPTTHYACTMRPPPVSHACTLRDGPIHLPCIAAPPCSCNAMMQAPSPIWCPCLLGRPDLPGPSI